MPAQQLNLAHHTILLSGETDFEGWRDAARRLALSGIEPVDVNWTIRPEAERQPDPPPPCGEESGMGEQTRQPPGSTTLRVPRDFIAAAETAILHSNPERFAFLYRLLWRLRSEPHLLKIASDPDIRRLEAMGKSVRRDIHKMRAFVRFRQIGDSPDERYVAWFEPDHYIVERNAPFFVRRFTGMRWAILTPHACADWDGERLAIGPGARKDDAPLEDTSEALWRTYYWNIFNPARLKVKAMQAEMPKKYWRNLPEASLIPDLIAGADEAAKEMIARMPSTPAPHHAKMQAKHWPVPKTPRQDEDGADARSIAQARKAAEHCRRCPLWREATQTVFGEGPESARIVFVGEQPGDQEDIAGKPFVGPAGKVFDDILEEADLDRAITYVTNAVKHFKFEPRGKRRIHSKPNAGEVQACRWWLDKELSLIKPDLVVALGATAAQSLLGKPVAITRMRGEVIERDDGLRIFLTIHPSFILRIREPEEKQAERERFLKDIKAVKALMA
ncbi:UdgX family uracil-DNA binding protein [Mesorhizobium sp. ZC-5]|uniref:UdgX family uracil-DNA binding protein n=1 Tax=Mesorhizobium sp. ZC-5 TaxID=2986066 RepID=UPI0021E76AEF|nr:UdgX family uracil-DNA binding protein [Mesorhizobium sp. ZC-5]MCV3238355.1 UdgX family uracil-DNA binding protein [Mesorhizobium sp. ZC-5]